MLDVDEVRLKACPNTSAASRALIGLLPLADSIPNEQTEMHISVLPHGFGARTLFQTSGHSMVEIVSYECRASLLRSVWTSFKKRWRDDVDAFMKDWPEKVAQREQ